MGDITITTSDLRRPALEAERGGPGPAAGGSQAQVLHAAGAQFPALRRDFHPIEQWSSVGATRPIRRMHREGSG